MRLMRMRKKRKWTVSMRDKVIMEYRKGRECVIVMGDFNGKVGENREEDTIGPFGVGVRNDNGERLANFCKTHNLFVTNTWFQHRKSEQHTWISPDNVTKKSDRSKSDSGG